MKFGLFYEMSVPVQYRDLGQYSEKEMYGALLHQVQLAEKLGFHIVWLPEHHYNLDYSHISAPDVTLMHLAAHTKTIHLGPAVVVIPIHHPVMVAERYATLDLLSNGRLELGVGRGAFSGWLDVFAPGKVSSLAETRGIFFEGLEVIRKAWTQEWFTHEGTYFPIKEPINVIPKPLQKPHPPIHAPCTGADSLDVYPKVGLNAQSVTWAKPLIDIEGEVKRFRVAWAAGQKEGNNLATRKEGEFSCLINVYCGSDRKKAFQEAKPYWEWWQSRLKEFYTADRIKRQGGRVPYGSAAYYDLSFEACVEQGMVCAGTPDDCYDYISKLNAYGVDTTFAQFQIGPMPFETASRSIELFGTQVMPHFTGRTTTSSVGGSRGQR